MTRCSVEASQRRLNSQAWALAAAATAVVGIRLAMGHPPRLPESVTDRWLAWALWGVERDIWIGAIVPAVALVLTLVIGPILWSRLVGRRSSQASVSRRVAVSPLEANALVDSACARLLALGYTIGPRTPTADGGWVLKASRKSGLGYDLRRQGQVLEFRLASGELVVSHQTRLEMEYREWLVDRLAAGASLEHPPRELSGPLSCVGVATFAMCMALTALHDEDRARFMLGASITLLASCVHTAGAAGLTFIASRRRKASVSPWIAGLFVLAASWAVLLSIGDAWERSDWRTSDDPEVVARAGFSAFTESWAGGARATARDDAALCADLEARRRLVAMGPRALPALVRFRGGTEFGRNWRFEVQSVLRAPTPEEVRDLLADGHADVRAWIIHVAPRRTDAFDEAVVARLEDSSADVRSAALDYIESRLLDAAHPVAADLRPRIGTLALRLLADGHRASRAAAILGELRHAAAADALLAKLESQEPHDLSSFSVLGALQRLGDSRAMAHARKHPHMLAGFGSAGVEILLDRGEHRILRWLPRRPFVPDEKLVARLLALADGSDPEMRRSALVVLCLSDRPEAARRVQAALPTADGWWVAGVLWKRGVASEDDVVGWLASTDEAAAEVMHWIDDPRFAPAVRAIVEDPRRAATVRTMAWGLFTQMSPGDVAGAAERLLARGTWIFGPLPERAPARLQIARLRSPDRDVRLAAICALAMEPDASASPALLEVFSSDADAFLRTRAAWALGRTRAPEAVPILLDALKREEWGYATEQLVYALGEIGDRRALAPLREFFDRSRIAGRGWPAYASAIALGLLGERDVLPWVRRAFYGRMLCGRPTDPVMLPDTEAAARALSRLGDEGAAVLSECAEVESRVHAWYAIRALGMSRSPRAFEALCRLLGSPNNTVRKAAALALGDTADTAALPHLVRALEETEDGVVAAAASAIAKLTGRTPDVPHCPHGTYTDRLRAAARQWASPAK